MPIVRGEGMESLEFSVSDKTTLPPKSKSLHVNMEDVKGYAYDMQGHVKQTVERYLELSGKTETSLRQVGTPCIDDHLILPEELEEKGELSPVAARIVLKALYVARVNRLDFYWAVNTLARCVTKWNKACDRRLHRLISYLHWTQQYVQMCWVGDTADNCVLAIFADASFAGYIPGSKSSTGAILCLVGPNTFVPVTWICKKQTAVSHSSTEAEVIALDTAVRLEGLPWLALWERVTEVFAGSGEANPGSTESVSPRLSRNTARTARSPSRQNNATEDNWFKYPNYVNRSLMEVD